MNFLISFVYICAISATNYVLLSKQVYGVYSSVEDKVFGLVILSSSIIESQCFEGTHCLHL